MKKLLVFAILVFTLSACNLAEQRVDKLRSLTERVEKRGNRFTQKEWKTAEAEYAQLLADFDDLTLTDAQADTVSVLKRRFTKACANAAIDESLSIVREAVDVITDGIEETIDNSLDELE